MAAQNPAQPAGPPPPAKAAAKVGGVSIPSQLRMCSDPCGGPLLFNSPDGHDTLQIPPDRPLPTKMDTRPTLDQDLFQLVSKEGCARTADVQVEISYF